MRKKKLQLSKKTLTAPDKPSTKPYDEIDTLLTNHVTKKHL